MDRDAVLKSLTALSRAVDALGYEVLGDDYEPPKRKRKRGTPSGGIKKPISAYFYFCAARRQSASPGEDVTAKALGACWKSLPERDKKPYEQQALADKMRYDDAIRAAA